LDLLEKNKNTVIVFLNLIVVAVLVIVFKPHYIVNDDNGIIQIVCGAYGTPDAHMVYSNYVLGLLLSGLYRIIPQFPWYGVLYYALMLFAFCKISMVSFRRTVGGVPSILCVIVLLVGAFGFYCFPTFTKVAAIVGIGGMVSIMDAIGQEKPKIRHLLSGAVLCVFSFFIRSDMFFAVAGVSCGMLIPVVVSFVKEHGKKEIKRRIVEGIICASVFFFILGTAECIDHFAYASEEWTAYCRYNALRAQLMDFGWPDYDQNIELYSELRIDRDALELYQKWDFNDPDHLSVDTMEKLVHAKEKRTIDFAFILNFLYSFLKYLVSCVLFYVCIVLLVLWGIQGDKRKDRLLSIVFSCAVLVLMFAYLYYIGRMQLERVNFGILYSLSVSLFYIIGNDSMQIQVSRKELRLIEGTAIGGMLLICVVVYSGGIFNTDYRARLIAQETLKEITEQEGFIFTDVLSFDLYDSFFVFDTIPQRSLSNHLPLGGWATHLPSAEQVLKEHHIVNPFRALVDEENVYLADGKNVLLIWKYLKNHYCEDLKVEVVHDLGELRVYKFVVDEN